MKKFVLKLIKFYQKYFSIEGRLAVCRFTPTCSEYTYQAVEKYGVAKGCWLGFRRVLRCHPWAEGGFDPVK